MPLKNQNQCQVYRTVQHVLRIIYSGLKSYEEALLLCTLYSCAHTYSFCSSYSIVMDYYASIFFIIFKPCISGRPYIVGSVFQMFCPAVGVIQCCDADDATEAQESEFSLRPPQSCSSHSSLLLLTPAFCHKSLQHFCFGKKRHL